MKETHLFILWENARNKENEILDDIKKNFNIIGLYNIKWNKEKFSNNLSRFYGTNLPENSGKEQHCGNGDFLLVIVEVENPIYEKRDTSKGEQIVNVNMFDKKTYYRELTGGGHKVHATNSVQETNHDLTLLLGKNIEDYLKEINKDEEVKTINLEQDLLGVDGFKTVSEMFYALNNCINYAIIRNYETLPEEIYVNEHNDIDIICDSYENAAYILNAEKVFQEEYRVHYKVKVESKFAFFDLRYVGDNYYDCKMEQEILNNRIYNEKGFYTISDEQYFYSLIYHAILHKPEFANDYKQRLIKMNKTGKKIESEQDFKYLLNKWLLNNNYKIVKPIDNSVQFNEYNANEFKIINDLSEMRRNIISWYPFSKEDTVLQLNANCEQITEELRRKVKNVVTTELNSDKITGKYDYIIIIGIEDFQENLENILRNIKSNLNENGKILIALDNKYGVNNICKIKDVHSSIKSKITTNRYSLKQAIYEIENAGFKSKKIYYPLTDYKFTNVLFTDKQQISGNDISRNIVYNNEKNIKFFEQNDLFKELLEEKNPLFKELVNSYFIEIFNNEYVENGINLVSYSNMRKKEYRIKTIVEDDFVYKYPENDSSKLHIQNIKNNIDIMKKLNIKSLDNYDEEKIISKYTKGETLDKTILKMLKTNKKEAIDLVLRFKKYLYEKLEDGDKNNNVFEKYGIEYDKDILNNIKITQYGLWDLIFQNCFFIDNELYFYDQEWKEENLPIDFILYRSIKYFDGVNDYIPIEELFEKVGLTKDILILFDELDNKIQNEIRDENIWNIHIQGEDVKNLYIQKLTDNHTINLLNADISYKDGEINKRDTEIQNLKNEIMFIKQSKSWKLTAPLRKLRRLNKK